MGRIEERRVYEAEERRNVAAGHTRDGMIITDFEAVGGRLVSARLVEAAPHADEAEVLLRPDGTEMWTRRIGGGAVHIVRDTPAGRAAVRAHVAAHPECAHW